jgi:hypothetical protein
VFRFPSTARGLRVLTLPAYEIRLSQQRARGGWRAIYLKA